MPKSKVASLQTAIETLRRLEREARERGSMARAVDLDQLASAYEAEVARLTGDDGDDQEA